MGLVVGLNLFVRRREDIEIQKKNNPPNANEL